MAATPELPQTVKQIHHLFLKKKATFALAESCTGGLLSYWLTQLPGASQFFLGALVSYSPAIKKQQLHIPSSILDKQGAVNSSVCQMMAQNIQELWQSDWALSVTGVAGPDRTPHDPPVGTVFVGIAGPARHYQEYPLLFPETSSRQHIQEHAARQALEKLYTSVHTI